MSEFVIQALKKKESRKEEPNDEQPADRDPSGDEEKQ